MRRTGEAGSFFRGRPMTWDADEQAIEQERQHVVDERVSAINEATADLLCDPQAEYAAHRKAYEDSGDPEELRLALEYVR